MIDIICALCGKNQQVKERYPATFKEKDLSFDVYSARRLPDRIHYRIVQCQRCGLIFSSQILPHRQLAKFYRESFCNYDEQIPYLKKTYIGVIKKIKNSFSKRSKVLEVGCGNGFLLEELVKHDIPNVFGVEPSRKMVAQANSGIRKNIKVDIFKKGQYDSEKFNLICCFHTLDHLMDPNEFISESYNLLKKGGYVVVVVHDTGGLSVKLFGERSPIFDIEHIYLFNKKTLREIFEKHGFYIVEVASLKNTYPLSYWLRMAGLPPVVKSSGNNLLKLFQLDKQTLTLAGGNIYIIAQKIS